MPYPTFAKLSKHAASKLPSKESLENWETRMKRLGCDITKDIKTGTYHAWHGPEHTSSYRTQGENEEKPADKFKDQMPDSKEEYSAHDYAKEMEIRGEGEESDCIETLAKKHGVNSQLIANQLNMGIKVETEHTDDKKIATKIAMDHLNEDPHYYTKLAKMEGKSENEERRLDPKCWKGYHKAGTKMKGGVRVNKCVKSQNDEEEGDLMTHMKQMGIIAKNAKVTLPPHETEEEETCTCGCSDCPDRIK
jgi:hypothetical protein